MRTTIVCAGIAFLSCVAAFGQDAPAHHNFDSTDVHVSKAEFHGGTLLDMIGQAYGLDQEQILGGLVWLDRNRFEVTAKAVPTPPPDDLKEMFQALLADRFGLAVHKEEKAQPVFVLAVAKRGIKMRESSDASGHGCNGKREGDLIKIDCRSMTLAMFAQQMRGFSGGYVDHSVLDRTGLAAAYDFALSYTPRGQLRKIGQDGATNMDVTFFDALEKQLGLHLEQQQLPMPVIVIDRVNEKPTENPNAITKAAPAEPTEFEVATIKPTNPEVKQVNWPR